MSENVEALKNVIEDEPHFFMKIIDNDLRALTMITKHFMSKHGKGIIRPNDGSCGGKGRRSDAMTRRGDGWLAKCLIISNEGYGGGGLVVLGGKSSTNEEDCLDGYDGAGGGEVNGGGVFLGVFKSLLGEIPGEVIGEKGGETMGLDGEAIWLVKFLKGMGDGMFGTRLNFMGKSRILSLKFEFKLLYCSADSASSMCKMDPTLNNEGNEHLQNCKKHFVLVCA
ncbi:hypothetical protein Tco_0479066 [Tanacetum coccineum]